MWILRETYVIPCYTVYLFVYPYICVYQYQHFNEIPFTLQEYIIPVSLSASIPSCCSRQTPQRVCVENNGSYVIGFHRYGDTLDDSRSCSRLYWVKGMTIYILSLGNIFQPIKKLILKHKTKIIKFQVPPFLDFLVTWTAISNSFWNPFLYWLLNAHFRRISKDLLLNRVSENFCTLDKLYFDYLALYSTVL